MLCDASCNDTAGRQAHTLANLRYGIEHATCESLRFRWKY
jgi:hypothetical protein